MDNKNTNWLVYAFFYFCITGSWPVETLIFDCMNSYVLSLREIHRTSFLLTGGKGANLGELCRIAGINVPDGFCVTTEAYASVVGNRALGATIENMLIPEDIEREIVAALVHHGEGAPYAVRSSATTEDGLSASFAGQYDSYLNITGRESILWHIRQCWASLFTERAISYRLQNGFDDPRKIQLAVVVQKMIAADAAGVLFTADPLSGNRKVMSIEAVVGPGEALVSGLVTPDSYKVREGRIESVRRDGRVLTEEQIVQLERIGRTIEAHFGRPQDIEWCLAEGVFYIVQSRPITTLFPIPEVADSENHVYVSVGHQQMMTDAFRPLGISFWQLSTFRPMAVAGGRLFVDVTKELGAAASRDMLINVLGKSDPLIRDALTTLLDRGDFIRALPPDEKAPTPPNFQTLTDFDPALVGELMRQSEASIEALKQEMQTKTGVELIDLILADTKDLKKGLVDPRGFAIFMTAMNASYWLNEKMEEWLGERNAADTLSLSAPNNITSEMGLALLDVADVIRAFPAVIGYLPGEIGDDFLEQLPRLAGGLEARAAIQAFLDRFGMRCVGEIDITRTRWSEKPAMLVPMILSNIRNFEPGAGRRKLQQGLAEALKKESELLARLRSLPDGEQKAAETKRMIDLVRNGIGYREYPKYGKVSRTWVYKQALLREARQLVLAGVLATAEDIYYLDLDELRELILGRRADYDVIDQRKAEYKFNEKLVPPRILTSDGEVLSGRYNRENVPAGALVGLPVSSGVIEGRARVILKMEEAVLEPGDILVTAFTDPSWTPLFVAIKGLVTEVGGLMTHGAVIAREYGVPAVVAVANATRLIRDGQRIRVNGTEGYVEPIII
jgi:pyruvate,water dikinase